MNAPSGIPDVDAMSRNNLYELLGVPPNANIEEIRKSYLLRCKMMHPDRFDPELEQAEWELANAFAKDLNHAYSVLREEGSRAEYDAQRLLPSGEAETEALAAEKEGSDVHVWPRPDGDVKLGSLEAGEANYADLPLPIQRRLADRIEGKIEAQVAVQLDGAGRKYLWLSLFIGWYVVLMWLASGSRWGHGERGVLLAAGSVICVLQAIQLSRVLAWHLSPLEDWLIVTPLYVIRTLRDRVWYWPVWEVSEIQGTNQGWRAIFFGAEMKVTFRSGMELFKLRNQGDYDGIVLALQTYERKFLAAKVRRDWRYFFAEDDFRDIGSLSSADASKWGVRIRIFAACTLSIIVSGLMFFWASRLNVKVPAVPIVEDPSLLLPVFQKPEVALPLNGEVRAYTPFERLATLRITAKPGSNYLVKLSERSSGKTVLTAFMMGGTAKNIPVPIGKFTVEYCRGEIWYGYEYLFGPDTIYEEASDGVTTVFNGGDIRGDAITIPAETTRVIEGARF